MSYFTYKLIHYLGIFILVATLGAALGRHAMTDGRDPLRSRLGAVHGVALFLVLLGGFGLMARVGVDHGSMFPGWILAKFGIWVLLGGVLFVARRNRRWTMPLLAFVPLLAVLAGWVAFAKPF
ncbi:MAG: hypothetical protein EA350_02955 [Gemmatimonadales bacterium]|nr:MAG: hypothetical protein EA350_02955 [Gemmatimonadales bacterium]